jgi:hypothetical protein
MIRDQRNIAVTQPKEVSPVSGVKNGFDAAMKAQNSCPEFANSFVVSLNWKQKRLRERESMSTPASKSDYMLLFRGTNWDKELSAEQLQKVVSDWAAWFERLTQQGKCKGGHPLQSEGKIVSGKKGRTVADGPFAESKEAIGGYFYLQVADMDEALEIAKQCPGLDYGAVVEVRPVAEMCAARARALESSSHVGQIAAATA